MMINLLISAFLGVLVGKIIDIFQSSKMKQNLIYICTGVFCTCMVGIYTMGTKLDPPVVVFHEVKKIIEGWDVAVADGTG